MNAVLGTSEAAFFYFLVFVFFQLLSNNMIIYII
jgi:hypothetical protein